MNRSDEYYISRKLLTETMNPDTCIHLIINTPIIAFIIVFMILFFLNIK